jgi:hypothetical protein
MAIAAALLAAACGGAADALSTSPVERPFAPGGRVHLRLGGARYVIQSAPDDRISVAWKATSEDGDPRVSVETTGAEATVRVDGPKVVTIGVPARSDLWVRATAGDITIRGVTGHKDVSAFAGELKIVVGNGGEYRAVNTSVLAGEIQAPSMQGSKGGVFRTFLWNGPGTYDLRAELTAGNIQLRPE